MDVFAKTEKAPGMKGRIGVDRFRTVQPAAFVVG
jgi:hypothetical protein